MYADSQVFNVHSFYEVKNLIGDNFLQMLDRYVQDSRGYITSITAGLHSGQTEIITRNVHSLKSSSACLGLSALARIAQEIEDIVRFNFSVEAVQHKMGNLEVAFDDALNTLERYTEHKFSA